MSIRANELSRVTTIDGNADVILVDPSTNSGSIISAQALADSGVPHGYNDLKQKVAALGGGTPAAAKTVSEMTDKTRLYVYTGSEAGYTAGDWYYWNGSAWTSGGAYGDIALDDTLTVQGAAADAKATGDAIGTASNVYLGLYPIETASGPIAVIHDGADDLPVRDLSVGIEPAQSLNGYERPWAGGAGKNILPLTAGTKSANGVTATINANGVISLSGTATADGFLTIASGLTFQAGTYTLKEFTAGGKITSAGTRSQVISSTANTGLAVVWSDAQGTAKSGTLATASDYIFRIRIENGKSYAGITITTMLVKGSDAPTAYEPYSNICPISGWDAVKVARAGKNLLPVTAVSTTLYGVTFTVDDRGAVTAVGTSTAGNKSVLDYGHVHLRPGTYVLSGCPAGGTDETYRLRLGIGSYAGDALTVERGGGREFTITEPMDLYARIYVQPAAGAVNQTWLPMIRLADDSATWSPSEAEVEDITLPTTVYGGTLDVTKGILTVDRGFVTWNGSEDWVLSGGKKVRCNIYALQNLIKRPASASEILEGLQASYLTAQTDNATYQGTVGISCQTNGVVGITLTGEATTVDAVKAYLAEHPLQVVYPLATPITYTLTPVQVKTLLGENRIYADAGQVTVKYRADFNEAGLMYIPKAPTADGTYRLTVDVTGGTPTYRWEAAE